MARMLKHMGRILAVLFALVVATFTAGYWYPPFIHVAKVLLGGFIGGFTNTVAIKMMFEKRWFLPGSGVLYENRDRIIASLASTAERHLLSTELMKERIGEHVRRMDLHRSRQTANRALNTVRDDVIRYLRSPEVHRSMRRMIKNVARRSDLGFLPRLMVFVGLKDKQVDELADQILEELRGRAAGFHITNRMLRAAIRKAGTLEAFIFKPGNPVLTEYYDYQGSMADYFLDHLKIRELVIRNLSSYSAGDITRIIEENIREHLSWLEFFGVVLGLLLSGVFELLGWLPTLMQLKP
jgi:uncharacterized membrane protein YheB (UPF0754 family)